MRYNTLDPTFKAALIDRLEAWELVEFLQTHVETIVELLEDDIALVEDDLKDLINMKENNSE